MKLKNFLEAGIQSISKPTYSLLLLFIAAWIASVSLIMFPTIGLTTPVFPPKRTPIYQFILLGLTTCCASLYSAYFGYHKIFKE